MGWGHYSVPVKPNRHAPLSNTNPGPTCQPPRAGEPKGPAQTSSLSSVYKSNSRGKYPPTLCRFFLPAEVSTAAARHQLAAVLPNDSTIPLVDLLITPSCFFCPRFPIIGQELWPPPRIPRATSADAGELSLLCFPLLMRNDLISALPMCSSGTELGTLS
jgi:hypothetical protein